MADRKTLIKYCKHCGKQFETIWAKDTFCSKECKETNYLATKRENNRKYVYEKKKKTTQHNDALVADAVAAKKLGMSYGQYSALKALGKLA